MPLPNIEKTPWAVDIERNSAGLVSHVRVIAAEPRYVTCTVFETTADRVGRRTVSRMLSSKTDKQPAVVCDCGVPYAGLAAETLLAHGDLIAAAPDLYEALERTLKYLRSVRDGRTSRDSIHESFLNLDLEPFTQAFAALAKARGESPDAK